ncbi:MAG TPA: protein kinase [Phycisphaerales bacterium]|nr:protein kinase [Phycisphaerales bacterium]
MESDRFQRVMEAFERAANLPTSERDGFLREYFPSDADARQEVVQLLQHHDGTSHAVATAAGLDAASTLVSEQREPVMPPLRGEYRIVRTIGEGGMGIVFEAEQAFPRRRVAVKALRPGYASTSMLRRFRNEAEFLAKLQHPNIAQIYEAGVAGPDAPDQPYFVMELVRGDSLTAYARKHDLGPAEKWRLLLQVCDAVQHAHQRGVIHRDLKPANILINTNGVAKVLDFGIARAAETDANQSQATREGQLIGTPSYMSPEQLLEGDVSTASDIYALGVIAYELFTHRLPIDLSTAPIAKAAAILADARVPPVSQFDRSLRGDGETIIAKAMSSDAKRRYASAEALAEDIRRMLAGEAILARGDSAVYVLVKQAKRYRMAAALAVLGLTALVVFAIIAQLNAREQERLAKLADAARQEAVRQREAADAATQEANASKAMAQSAERVALEELMQANIERGRMAATTRNLPLAEDTLWSVYLNNPRSRTAFWAIWDMYRRNGSQWTTQPIGWPSRAAASQDGSVIVAVADAAVRVINPHTGEVEQILNNLPSAPAGAVAAWPDGSRIAIALARGGIAIRSLDGESEPISLGSWENKPPLVRLITVSADGSTIAAACNDKTIRFWDARTGEMKRVLSLELVAATLELTRDGSRAAVAMAVGGGVAVPPNATAVYDLRSGEVIFDLTPMHTFGSAGLRFSADDRLVYLDSGDARLVACDMASKQQVFNRKVLRSRILCHMFSPDGSRLLLADRERTVVIDAYTGAEIAVLPIERYGATTAAWTSPEDITVLLSDGVVRNVTIVPEPGTTRLTGYTSWCFSVTMSPDDSLMAFSIGSGLIEVREMGSMQTLATYQLPGISQRTRGMKFLQDNRTLVIGSQDSIVRVIDAWSGDVKQQFPAIVSEIYGFDINPQETLCAVGHWNRRTAIYDLRTGESLCELPIGEKRVDGLAFTPDGTTLAVCNNNFSVTLWDVASSQVVGQLTTTAGPWAVAFSPDGSTAYVTTYNGTLEVFDVRTRQRLHVMKGHPRLIPGLALSRDGTTIATGGEDGFVRLWDAATLRPLASFSPSAAEVVSLAFTSNTDRIAAGVANFELVMYDLPADSRLVDAHKQRFTRRK